MSGKLISAPISALQDAVESGPAHLIHSQPLWSEERIYRRVMAVSFVHKEFGDWKVHGLEYENARRLMLEMQMEYWAVLEESNSRLRAWQTEVAIRDRRIAELKVECAMRDERIAEFEQLVQAPAPQEKVD